MGTVLREPLVFELADMIELRLLRSEGVRSRPVELSTCACATAPYELPLADRELGALEEDEERLVSVRRKSPEPDDRPTVETSWI
jgi:hypothetical protein